MAGSWKNLKQGQFKRTATVEIMDGKALVFQSLNPVKEKAIISNLLKVVEVPIKERKATKEEKDEYEKINPQTNKVAIRELKVVYYDYTDETYQKELKEQEGWITLALELINVDLKQKVGKTELWEDLGLKNDDDFIGLAKFLFEYLEIGREFLEKVKLAQRQIKGDLISKGFLAIENMFKDENQFDLLATVNEVLEKKRAEKVVEVDEIE